MSDERERERVRNVNRMRFQWHERLIADPKLHKGSGALAFAGLVLHRFSIQLGYAEISTGYASARLQMPVSTVHRGRRLLLRQGWIAEWMPLKERKRRLPDLPQRYTLAGGPDDLLLDELGSATDGTPATDDIPD